jgi:hypothetical protein
MAPTSAEPSPTTRRVSAGDGPERDLIISRVASRPRTTRSHRGPGGQDGREIAEADRRRSPCGGKERAEESFEAEPARREVAHIEEDL